MVCRLGRLAAVLSPLLACVETVFEDGTGAGASSSLSSNTTTSGSSGAESPGGMGGTGGGGGDTVSTTTNVGGTGGTGGTPGTGGTGTGGGPACAPDEVGSVPACGPLHTFDTQASYAAAFNENGPGQFQIVNGTLAFGLPSGATLTWVETAETFQFEDCAIWARVVDFPNVPTSTARVSIGIQPGNSLYNVNAVGDKVIGHNPLDESVEAAFDSSQTPFLRLRAGGGLVHYGFSADGICWSEFGSFPFVEVDPTMYGRLTLIKVAGATDDLAFDDFCVQY